jgi:DAK2 domain fusion protein YloV
MYVAEMKKTLTFTPDMLSVLKDAGVVDSGAYGFILIFEGMLKFLTGEYIDPGRKIEASPEKKTVDYSLFDENSEFTDGYCMEFILQLMRGENYSDAFRLKGFISSLEKRGESIVCVQDGMRVKVHIHTKTPAPIIHIAQKYGEFLTFKLENMQLQHNEVIKEETYSRKLPHKKLAIVSVVNGVGLKTLFEELGADVVICCGETMNASSQEFVDAFNRIDADDIVVFPNNKNVILAAQQAAQLHGGDNIHILPSRSIAEGYFAVAMDVPDNDNKYRINSMRSGLRDVTTLIETTASRDYSYHDLTCRQGEEIVLMNGEIVSVNKNWLECLIEAMRLVPDIDDAETCVVFSGEGVSEDELDELSERLEEEFPMLEAEIIDGGQKLYRFIIGLS